MRKVRASTILLVASSIGLIVAFLWRVEAWWAARSQLMGPTMWSETAPELLEAPAQEFHLVSLEGDTIAGPIRDTNQLVIAYSTTCVFCQASVTAWRRVIRAVCDDLPILLVSVEPIERQVAYWDKEGSLRPSSCNAESVVVGRVVDPVQFGAAYGVRGTPVHLVIGGDGYLHRRWIGAVARRAAQDSLVGALRAFY